MTPPALFPLGLFVPSGLPEGMRICGEDEHGSGIGYVIPRFPAQGSPRGLEAGRPPAVSRGYILTAAL